MLVRKFLRRYPAFLYPAFRKYWTGSFAYVGATNLVILGQGWLVFELTGSPLQLGFLGAAAAVPGIIVNLVGGVVADRFNKRTILLWTCSSNAVLLALLTLLVVTGVVALWHVLVIAAISSLVTGIDWPVRAAIYPLLVRRHSYLSAVALNSFIWQSSRTTIPAIGGAILLFGGTATVFAVAAAGFLTMLFVTLAIPLQEERTAQSSPIKELVEGISFIYKHDLFKWLLALTFLGMFFVQSYVQLMPYIVELLEQGEAVYGLLLAAGGFGSIVGTLIIGGMKWSRITGNLMLACAALSALGTMVIALVVVSNMLVLAFVFALVSAIFAAIFQINAMATMQLAVPQRLRGRVMGFHTVCYNLIPLGGLFLGYLTEALNLVAAMAIACAAYILVISYVAVSNSTIRSIGREPIREMVA